MGERSACARPPRSTRRGFLAATASAAAGGIVAAAGAAPSEEKRKALIAITLDLEMSAEYPKRGMTEWNYRKGDLDAETKRYAVEAAAVVRSRGGRVHFFALGQTLEQGDVGWLKGLAEAGHPIGNHTYDHVNLKATDPEAAQFRFRRAPWLVRGRTAAELIEDNVADCTRALKARVGVDPTGFRTPGGFPDGLADRPDLQAMLLRQGFGWVSSKCPAHETGPPKRKPDEAVYADIVRAQAEAQPFAYPSGLIEVPMSPISDVTAFRSNFWKLDWFLEAVRLAVGHAIETGGAFDFLAHPSCLVVEDPTFEAVKLICDLVNAVGDRAAIVDLGAIAAAVPDPRK